MLSKSLLEQYSLKLRGELVWLVQAHQQHNAGEFRCLHQLPADSIREGICLAFVKPTTVGFFKPMQRHLSMEKLTEFVRRVTALQVALYDAYWTYYMYVSEEQVVFDENDTFSAESLRVLLSTVFLMDCNDRGVEPENGSDLKLQIPTSAFNSLQINADFMRGLKTAPVPIGVMLFDFKNALTIIDEYLQRAQKELLGE